MRLQQNSASYVPKVELTEEQVKERKRLQEQSDLENLGLWDYVKDGANQTGVGLAELGSGVLYAAKDAATSAGFETVSDWADKGGDSFKAFQTRVGDPKTWVGHIAKEAPGEVMTTGGSLLTKIPHPVAKVAGGALMSVPAIATYGNSVEDQRQAVESGDREDINRLIPAAVGAIDIAGGALNTKVIDKLKDVKSSTNISKADRYLKQDRGALERIRGTGQKHNLQTEEQLSDSIKKRQKRRNKGIAKEVVANIGGPLALGGAYTAGSSVANNYVQYSDNVKKLEGLLSGR